MRYFPAFPVLLVAALLLSLMACSDDPTPAPAVTKKPKAPKPQPIETQVEVREEKPVFNYETSRRDPFNALIHMRRPQVEPEEPLTPLQTVEVEQLRLTAVIIGRGEPRALVVAPGGKSYILTIGTKVGRNRGAVVAIDASGVQVREIYVDFAGAIRENIVTVGLPEQGGAF